jgi:hypothetical protein
MENGRHVEVSYCTTCHGRLWQIALTLFDNLRRLRDDEELVLLDYGSRDGLNRFIESSPACQSAMEAGRLVYARAAAKYYHCPKAKNLAHRVARGRLLVNLDADNSNGRMRAVISRRFVSGDDIILQMDEGVQGDPLRGTFGRICVPRYWFYRLGGYDEAFEPIGHQDQDLIWRAKSIGLKHVVALTGGPAPVRNTMVEKASHTGKRSWHVMWRANEKASRSNLKDGRLVANPQGWGSADVAINFNEERFLPPVAPQLISVVLVHRHSSIPLLVSLLDRYSAMHAVGEILLVNFNPEFTIVPHETNSKVRAVNGPRQSQPFPAIAAGALADFPAVLLTSDDVFLPEELLNRLHKAWFRDPSALHALAPRASRRREDVDLSLGVLTTPAACMTALAHGARLCAEVKPDPLHRCEDILLSFSASPNPGATVYHPADLAELTEPGRAARSRPRPRRTVALTDVSNWSRRNIARVSEPMLIVEAGAPAPQMINAEPFFAARSKEAVMFAGPWIGEFGWELCWWNPMIRALCENYGHVIVAAPESSRYLYEFATEFVPLKTEGWRFAEGRLLSKVPRICNGAKVLDPTMLWEELGLQECDALRTGDAALTPKKWRSLAPAIRGPFIADVLCAFRPEKVIDDRPVVGKDYPAGQCEELVGLLLAAGLSVACYGGPDNYWFEGAADLRGQPLHLQCSALSAAKCAVGPSSAPLHLASLTGCPHVTWSRISEDIAIRYADHWNPFHTPACFIRAPEPSPAEIACEVLQAIEETAASLSRQAAAV